MIVEYSPIGVVRSPFSEQEGTPIQPSRADGARGTVEVFPEFAEGLSDLDGFSHIILLCHLHQSSGWRLRVVPFLDTEPRGLFATRAPRRPNPIGLSVVNLLAVDGNVLSIENVDLLDGTPVLDIKPFVGEFDARTEIRIGWLETARLRRDRADDRFSV
jgi:tRNA-Thr(GGU) m(6)t(6)A37 methyltransferase TsaA